jgi:hypothetical protein
MRLVVLGLVAACSSPAPVHLIDGGQGRIDYTLYVSFDSTRIEMPQVFIDGVQTAKLQRTYEGFTDPIQHDIELRYADHVLARMPVGAAAGDCGPPDATWLTISQSVEALVSGDLRYIGDEWRGDGHACTGDGFGIAHCGCQATERCGPLVTLADPLFTRMTCMPIGPKQINEACSFTSGPDGAYDDCGADLVCYQGTCHALCATSVVPCATTCVQPDGYPREAILCM